MSLLQGLIGFGVGATQAIAETKKEDMAAARQANLARLQAQYKGEAELEQARRVAGLATSESEEDQAVARILGYKPPTPIEPLSPLGKLEADRERARRAGNTELVNLYDEAIKREARGTQTTEAQSTIGKLYDDYDAAVAAGNQAEADNIMARIEKEIAPSAPLVDLGDERESKFATDVGAADAATVTAIRQRALRAADQLSEISRIEAALDSGRFTTGVFARPRQFLSELASFIGLDPEANDQLKKWLGSAATADTIDAAANLIATNLLGDVSDTAGTRSSNMLLSLIKESGPQLSRTLEGNKLILEVLKRKAEQDRALNGIVTEYVRLGTAYPEGMPDMSQAIINYRVENPVVDSVLRDRIQGVLSNEPTTEELATLPKISLDINDKQISKQAYDAALDEAGIVSGQSYIDGSGQKLIRP